LSWLPKLSPERQAKLADSTAGAFWSQVVTAVLIFNAFFARDLYHFSVESLYVYISLAVIYALLCFIISCRWLAVGSPIFHSLRNSG